MALSPLAVAAAVTGAAAVVRRAGLAPDVLSPRVLRFETWLGRLACAAMAVFLAGTCAWVAPLLGAGSLGAGGAGSLGAGGAGSLFRPGAIDVAGLAVLALALAVARQAAGQARVGAR
jgi:hypothetical protein